MEEQRRPSTSRRQFLQGRSAAEEAAYWARRAVDRMSSGAGEKRRSFTLEVARRAMATQFQVLLNAGQASRPIDPRDSTAAGDTVEDAPSAGDDPRSAAATDDRADSALEPPLDDGAQVEAAVAALDIVEQLEDQLSIYRPHSELSRLVERAKGAPIVVEHLTSGLFDLLVKAVELWELTEGAFDITSGPLSKVWGFHERRGRWPGDVELASARAAVGSDALRPDHERHRLEFLRPVELNLGAIGKGYALDQAAESLCFAGVTDFLIHGGMSSVLALGARAGDRGWPVGLMHPLRPDQRLGELLVRDRALGTSGCGNQFFHYRGRRLGHILDPRTGMPAEEVLSATVIAESATEADALATALYVLGPAGAERVLSRRPDLGALLVLPGERGGALEVVSWNINEDDWRPSQ